MRGRASRGRKSAPSTVTIPVQVTNAGAISANQFTGWTHSSGTVYSRTAYGVTTKYFGSSVSATVDIQSKAVSRDQEVTFWASIGRVYLRIANGKALRFETNIDSGGGWSVSYVSIGNSGYEDDTNIVSLGSGTPSGLNTSDTDGDLYVFGVSGFDVYVNWNGVEQWREKQIFCIDPGRVGLRCHPSYTTYGFRSVSVDFKSSAALASSPEQRILDVRDFGVRALATTGSMTASSTTLTVASNPGFVIGDPIIVEIGGESGAGVPGTLGVGGQWPTLTYANATAMNADTSQVDNKVCALLDTGVTYYWDDDLSSWELLDTENGYQGFMLPKALLTTITNISGTTFTLADAAVVDTTAANVYLNAYPKYAEVLGAVYFTLDDYIADFTVEWPAGNFAWGVYNEQVGLGSNRIRWTIRGQGIDDTRIFSPEGTLSLNLSQGAWTGPCYFHDIELLSNCRADGGYHFFYNATTELVPQGFPQNLIFGTTNDLTIYNVRSMDANQSAVALSYCSDSTIRDCIVTHSTGHRTYTQWMLNLANCSDSLITDCTLDSDYLIAGFELFQSDGCSITNITARNALCSFNSDTNWRGANINATLETGCLDADYLTWHSQSGQLININTQNNLQGEDGPSSIGLFEDFHLVQEPNIRTGQAFPLKMIAINGAVNYITIKGQFPDKPNTLGLIEMPDYDTGEAQAVIADNTPGRYLTIDGVRVIGTNASTRDIQNSSVNGVVQNCVAESIYNLGTGSGNITNAAYEALP